jgi:hypothetical protein
MPAIGSVVAGGWRRPRLSGGTGDRDYGDQMVQAGRHGGWADNSTALLGYVEDADRWTDNPVTGL